MTGLFAEEMLVLFAILAIGQWLGQLSVKNVSLGTAGVFFVALVFGHFGLSVPKAVMDLGLLLFVYAVGLQAGPRFFRTFRRQGRQFVMIALATVLTGALATVAAARIMNLPYDLASGLFTGALTCTPALAAAVDAVARIAPAAANAAVSVGYGVAYPFSMVGVVLLVQFLPRLLRRDLRQEEASWQQEQYAELPALEARQYLVSNPNAEGRSLRQVNPGRMSRANISRVRHDEQVLAARPDLVLHRGDVVMVVGPQEELDKMSLLLGEETHVAMDGNTNVVSADCEVTSPALAGKRLAGLRVWERYGVVITRIRRQGLEIAPVGTSAIEMGDMLRVVGDREAVDGFVRLLGANQHRADEINMLPFLVGLLAGIVVGAIPLRLPNGIVLKLGTAGGAFIVSLLVGHFGGVGPLRLYVPPAAKNLSRELGLMLFLAGAGTNAGSQLLQVIGRQGWGLLLAGAVVTTASVMAGLLLMVRVYRMRSLAAAGALCACMTNPPGLGAANTQTDTDLPALAYASVYPVALIFKILAAQVLVGVLQGWR